MLNLKKIVAVATTIAAVSVPSLALADNHYDQRDNYSIQQMGVVPHAVEVRCL